MGKRYISNAADGTSSAAEIFYDPYEHTYSEESARDSYLRLSAKRGLMPPENFRVANTYVIIDQVSYERKFGKNLYE